MAETIPLWTVGDRIRKARLTAGLDQREVARALGVTDQTISCWENGVNNPKRYALEAVARLCEVPTWWLLDEAPERAEGVRVTLEYPASGGLAPSFALAA